MNGIPKQAGIVMLTPHKANFKTKFKGIEKTTAH